METKFDTLKEYQIPEDRFFEMTRFVNWSDDREDDFHRAQLLGLPEGVYVKPGAIVKIPRDQVGEGTVFGLYTYVNGNVTLGRHVLIGPHSSVTAGNHLFDPETGWFSARSEAVRDDRVFIDDGCWLASNVTVTGGVHMGKCNLVCAGAVVTKSTPDYAIMAGVPARQVGRIDPETGEYLWFSHEKKEG